MIKCPDEYVEMTYQDKEMAGSGLKGWQIGLLVVGGVCVTAALTVGIHRQATGRWMWEKKKKDPFYETKEYDDIKSKCLKGEITMDEYCQQCDQQRSQFEQKLSTPGLKVS